MRRRVNDRGGLHLSARHSNTDSASNGEENNSRS